MAIGKEKIDVETGELVLKFNKEKVVFNAYEWKPYLEDLETCYQMEEKGSKVQKGMTIGVFTGVRVYLCFKHGTSS